MSDAGRNCPGRTHFHHMDLKMMSGLKGFHIMALANNHIMDFGPEALYQCMDGLSKMRIASLGAGRNIAEATNLLSLKGRHAHRLFGLHFRSVEGFLRILQSSQIVTGRCGCGQSISFICISQRYPHDLERMKEDIKKAKGLADVVVVSIIGVKVAVMRQPRINGH